MIEPQIHNGQRGVIGEQHGLAKLTSTLEILTKGQTTQQQRDTQIQEHLATLARELAPVAQALTRLTRRSRHLAQAVGVLAGLTLGLGGLMGWHVTHRPDMGYARALGALDATLAQTWTTLPKGAQERLADAYRQLGMLSPGLRK